MKKRLISLLVALCMAVTLLPVSAITAWAEESSQLKIVGGYPVGSGENHDRNCSGDGWSYDGSTQTLTLDPSTPTTYDLKESGNIRQDQNSILCSAIIEKNATIVNGNFLDIDNPGPSITNDGTITSGSYSMPVINHGTITGGTFFDPITNDPTGTIENGTFLSTVTNNGTIKGGIFRKKPTGGTVHKGYTLNVNQNNGSYEIRYATINGLGSSGYVIPNSDHDTSVTIKYTFFRSSSNRVFSNDVTFEDTNDTPCLLEDWAPSARYSDKGDNVYLTFTAPPATAATVTLSILTRLVIDENGYPVGTEGGTQDYSGNGIPKEKQTTGDVRIEFYVAIKTAEPFLPAGTVIAREQTYVHTFYKKEATAQKPATSKEEGNLVAFFGPDFKATFDKQSGLLTSYLYKKHEYILNGQGPRPFFWRAPTDNDYGANLPVRLKAWKEASYQEPKAESFQVTPGSNATTIKVTYRFPQTDARWDITYKIYASGVIKVDNRFMAEGDQAPMIPRVGLRMQLPESFTDLTYYGRGPKENYRDRRTSQFIGEYAIPVKNMYEPYVRPQENNHRTDIYWCALTDKTQRGLLLIADRTFELNASNYPLESMDSGDTIDNGAPRTEKTNHRHLTDPLPEKMVDLFIDYRMMGVGGDDSWGATAHEPYLIRPGKENAIEYGFTLVPFDKKEDYKYLIRQY